jgi:peroxiredoxin-like protein
MDSKPYFIEAEWTGDRSGHVQAPPIKQLEFSAPPEFGGKDGVWTPEHLLLAAVGTCYVATFSAIAEHSRFHFRGLKVAVEAALEKGPGGLTFARITLRPRLVIQDETQQAQALVMLEKAKKGCIISRSLAAEVRMDASVECCGEERVPQLVY